jgi:hypothetical protein
LEAFGKIAATSKVHKMGHISDDIKSLGVHMEVLSAYKYENFQRFWGNSLRSGTNPNAQNRSESYIYI